MIDPATSVEQRVVAAILARIRSRRAAVSSIREKVQVASTDRLRPARIRDAQFSDFDAVGKLKEKWGLIPDPFENWQRMWRQNPALTPEAAERPIGWILEADDRVVGYLGNIPLPYLYGGRPLRVVAGHCFVVEPPYRGTGLSLMAAFFRQSSVDLFITTTAVESVGKIARAYKSDPLPQPDYETVLFWVLRSRPFAQCIAENLSSRPSVSWIGKSLVSVAVGVDRIIRRRRPQESSRRLSVREIAVSEIGDDFQGLWIEILNERPRLLADRSPAVLRWHFQTPHERGTTRVLCCYASGKLLGYLVIRSESAQTAGIQRSLIADALVKHDDPEILQALLAAAYDHAKQAGSHVLEVLGFPKSIRQICLKWNPYQRKYPSCPFLYKAVDPILRETLSDPAAWYATPFDGDTTLWP